jgi:hypothetical protein
MPRWAKCTIETYFAGPQASLTEPCEVVIGDGRIAVSQAYEGVGHVTFSGPELEPGHFTVTADKISAKGSLHKFSNSKRLEGYWVEEGAQGMWRIDLIDGDE